MAKQTKSDTLSVFNRLKSEVLAGKFAPIYLLMGEEPYYVDLMCDCIQEHALAPHERDFNQTIVYGNEIATDDLAALCYRYPMMAERQLVIVREAQQLKKIEDLEPYVLNPAETTVLVLAFSGKNVDKRTRFAKTLVAHAQVLESKRVDERSLPQWIEECAQGLGKRIDPDAAMLLGEYAGNDLRKLALQMEKLVRSMEPDQLRITSEVVEKNTGVSREFNSIELADALGKGDAQRAFRIAHYLTEASKVVLPPILGYLIYFYYRLELIQAIYSRGNCSFEEAANQAGVRYAAPFKTAARRCSLPQTCQILQLIRDMDYKSKSNLRGEATDADLLRELVSRILSICASPLQ